MIENLPNRISEKPELSPYDLLYEGINLKEAIGNHGFNLIIPRIFLFGRQRRDEYSITKRKQVESAFRTEGLDFLIKNPIIVCALTSGKNTFLTIIDGHHRYRYSGGTYKINHLPCVICTPKVLVDVINKKRTEDRKLEEKSFIKELFEGTDEAMASFESTLGDYVDIRPNFIPNVTRIGQLKKRFKAFKAA